MRFSIANVSRNTDLYIGHSAKPQILTLAHKIDLDNNFSERRFQPTM